VAWGAARDLSAEERAAGLPILTRRLGFAPAEYGLARAVASMVLVSLAVFLPGVAAAALGLGFAQSGGQATLGLALLLALAAYALTFGVVMGGLARWAALLSPRHGRRLLALLVVGPPLLGTGPDLVGGFTWMLGRVLLFAGAVA
jgi:hypothetical protein